MDTATELLAEIVNAETCQTEGGDPKIALAYRVVEGPEAGTTIADTLALTDKALFRVVKVMRAVGIGLERKRVTIPFSSLIGRRMIVTVADGKVRDYAPPPCGQAAGSDEGSIRQVEARSSPGR
jgi:hypothetical protein